jgi:hypothetical protein
VRPVGPGVPSAGINLPIDEIYCRVCPFAGGFEKSIENNKF